MSKMKKDTYKGIEIASLERGRWFVNRRDDTIRLGIYKVMDKKSLKREIDKRLREGA